MRCCAAHGVWGHGSMMWGSVKHSLRRGHRSVALAPSWDIPLNYTFHSSSVQTSIVAVSRPMPAMAFVSGRLHWSYRNTQKMNSKAGVLETRQMEKTFVHSFTHPPREPRTTVSPGQYAGFIWLVRPVSSLPNGLLENSITEQGQSRTYLPALEPSQTIT